MAMHVFVSRESSLVSASLQFMTILLPYLLSEWAALIIVIIKALQCCLRLRRLSSATAMWHSVVLKTVISAVNSSGVVF